MRIAWKTILIVALIFTVIAPAGSAQTSRQSRARVLHFPRNRSLGKLMIQDEGIKRRIGRFGYWGLTSWEYFGHAMGDVVIPAGKRVQLDVSYQAIRDLSPLSKLGPNDLYHLSISFIPATDNCMHHLASLTGLKVLDLSATNISSKGLKYITNLKSLERLTAPDGTTNSGLAYIAKLPSLKRLYFRPAGPSRITNAGLKYYLGNLTKLEELALSGHVIGDEGLVCLAKLPSLYYLFLASDKFTNEGLAHLSNIPNLRILNIYQFRELNDTGLAHLGNLTKLERLSCIFIQGITDEGLVHIKKMRSLEKLGISQRAHITDDGAAHLAGMESLDHLSLPGGGLTDEGLVHLTKLNKLKYLRIGGGPFTNKSLEHIAKLQSLVNLHIGGSGITNTGLNYIATLRNLKSLFISVPQVTNEGLVHLKTLKSLTSLSLWNTKVTISGLTQLNSLEKLTNLNLKDIEQDDLGLDISGLINLEGLTIITKGTRNGKQVIHEPIHDTDLACLVNLKQLKRLSISPRTLSNTGIIYLANLTNIESLQIGGEGVTDDGLKYLSNMKKLDILRISGDFTNAGLRHLEGLKTLGSLSITSKNKLSRAVLHRLSYNLPYLCTFKVDISKEPK